MSKMKSIKPVTTSNPPSPIKSVVCHFPSLPKYAPHTYIHTYTHTHTTHTHTHYTRTLYTHTHHTHTHYTYTQTHITPGLTINKRNLCGAVHHEVGM